MATQYHMPLLRWFNTIWKVTAEMAGGIDVQWLSPGWFQADCEDRRDVYIWLWNGLEFLELCHSSPMHFVMWDAVIVIANLSDCKQQFQSTNVKEVLFEIDSENCTQTAHRKCVWGPQLDCNTGGNIDILENMKGRSKMEPATNKQSFSADVFERNGFASSFRLTFH